MYIFVLNFVVNLLLNNSFYFPFYVDLECSKNYFSFKEKKCADQFNWKLILLKKREAKFLIR